MKMMKKSKAVILLLLLVCMIVGCGKKPEVSPQTDSPAAQETEISEETEEREEMEMKKMHLEVNGKVFTASLEENEAVREFLNMMLEEPVTIQMSDYSGFEKVGPLGRSLPANNSQTTTQTGDIVLYNGNQIVIFYGSNSWSYTRLGHVDDLNGWEDALGGGDVTVTFSTEGQ